MTILIFFAVLVVLILAHEFGHFIVAKRSGIRVDEFGIGFPPKIFSKKIGETDYSINLLPIGGFVKIWGEDPTEEHYEEGAVSERSFVKQPRYIQALVLVAGVLMNVLLAYVLYVSAYMIGIPTAVDDPTSPSVQNIKLLVSSVLPDSPASAALKASDEIVSVRTDSAALTAKNELTTRAVSDFIASSEGPVTFEIVRRGEAQSITVTPVTGIISEMPERKATGISMTLVGTQHYPFYSAIIEGAKRTGTSLYDVAIGLGSFFAGVFTGKADLSQVTGPVGIVGLVEDAAALGFAWLLTFSAFISLNLAVINFLPFPALDGGRLMFVAIEAITRKPIKPLIASRVNQIGFIALLALMAIVTFRDIANLF